MLAIDDLEQSVAVARMAREHFPRMAVVALARNVRHYFELRELGVTMVERETLGSALMSARSALEVLGWQPHQARNLALRFRQHTIEQVEQMLPHRKEQSKLIAASKQGRQQLEEQFAQERQTPSERRERGGRDADASAPSAKSDSKPAA